MPNCQVCGGSEGHVLPNAWGIYCIPCLEKSKLCDGCNTIHLTTNVLVVGDQILCRDCAGNANTCDKCGALHVGGLRHRGKQYCPHCAASFGKCSICNKIHSKIKISDLDKLRYDILTEACVCATCFAHIQATVTPKEILTCKVCGKHHFDASEYEDQPCIKCQRKFITCICCGKVKHRIYSRNNSDQSVGLCDDCETHKCSSWKYCNSCGDFHKTENMSGRLCKKCAATRFFCPICHETRDINKGVDIEGTKVCEYCAKNCQCQKCSKVTLDSEGGYCYNCCDKHKIVRVNNYSFKPRFKMFGNGIHLGVENEIANVDETARKILASLPRAWMFMKSDSSVTNGVECVFHPTTLAYFQQNKALIDAHFKCSIEPHSSAGMHVHMSKDKFGTYQLFKFIQFFKDHADFIEKIAGRSGNSYAKRLDGQSSALAKTAKYTKDHEERYRAININNEHTIEVRIFAGVTTTKDFMKNIEFCDALYNFTKTSPHFKRGKIPTSYFVTYVEKYKNQYPNLNVFLGGTPPKEVPEKYKEEKATLVPTQETIAELPPMGVGSRVRYTSGHFVSSSYNPLYPEYDVIGTIREYRDAYCGVQVVWDRGGVNCYSPYDLTVVG